MSPETHSTRRYRGAIPHQPTDIFPPNQVNSAVYSAVEVMVDDLKPHTSMTIEGPPIYLGQNHPQLPAACGWNSLTFSGGWAVANAITAGVLHHRPQTRVYHPMLIDDLNYPPSDGFQLSHIRQLRSQPIFLGPLAHRSVVRREAEFKYADGDSCAVMDARFQWDEKLARFPQDTLHVVVHPIDFRSQQAAMLERSLGLMKTGTIFSSFTKEERQQVLGKYRHVWINVGGHIDQITRPVFNRNEGRFQHELIQ